MGEAWRRRKAGEGIAGETPHGACIMPCGNRNKVRILGSLGKNFCTVSVVPRYC
jgi:hypothetical protein